MDWQIWILCTPWQDLGKCKQQAILGNLCIASLEQVLQGWTAWAAFMA
jgi:hypothetical protein